MYELPKQLEEMCSYPNWVCFRLEPRPTADDPEHLGKVPYNPRTGKGASAKDPRTWADYETARRAAESGRYDGIGFELGNSPYCGIDMDNCIVNGQIKPEAAAVVRHVGSYTEYSISGTGLHTIAKSAPLERNGYSDNKHGEIDLEVYRPTENPAGDFVGAVKGGRFLTISGNVYGDPLPIVDRTKEVRNLVRHYWPQDPPKAPPAVGSSIIVPDDDTNMRMLRAALGFIAPADLSFKEWASVVSSMKACGFTPQEAEEWSASGGNTKNRPGYILKRWPQFHLKNNSNDKAGGAIVNLAKARGWIPAEIFTEEERRQYGRELHKDDDDRIDSGWKQHVREHPAIKPAQTTQEGAENDFYRPPVDSSGQDPKEPQEGAEPPALPGLLTYDAAVEELANADDSYLEIPSFPQFSATAKIGKHDSVVIAADTGVGKSSLALNFMNGLNSTYPCIYFNLEMDRLTVLRRMVAIQSGLELDQIEGYKNDPTTAAVVNAHLRTITSRKPLQIIQGAYWLEDVEKIIYNSTVAQGRTETTIVFIDHSLLLDTRAGSAGRYDRFTKVSESLRKLALQYNIILFVLLQQSRAGKADETERPKNSSLKESGSWENDATHITFLWYDPEDKRKKIIMTKHRGGTCGDFTVNYWPKTQTYAEAKDQKAGPRSIPRPTTSSRRDKQREKLERAYNDAAIATNGRPTLRAMAEAADVTTATVKGWIREYGGCTVDGVRVDPAGSDTEIDYDGFISITAAEHTPYDLNNLELPDVIDLTDRI